MAVYGAQVRILTHQPEWILSKQAENNVSARMQRPGNPYTLLVGMSNGANGGK